MDPQERSAAIAGWWEHHRLMSGTRDERKALAEGDPLDVQAGFEAVREMVDVGEIETVQFLADLNDARPEDYGGEMVGAGPLEDLINAHGDRLIDEIDRCARQIPSFRGALRGVWFSPGTLSPATERRLQQWVTFI